MNTIFHSQFTHFIQKHEIIRVKSFQQTWHQCKHFIGSLEPSGYTRIGAAIRHSSNLMRYQKEMNKWIIFLSDGKPNDYDKYQGNYGIHDVKKALNENQYLGINSYALTVENSAQYYLPRMFGMNNYQIVSTPQGLLKSLVNLFGKIKYS